MAEEEEGDIEVGGKIEVGIKIEVVIKMAVIPAGLKEVSGNTPIRIEPRRLMAKGVAIDQEGEVDITRGRLIQMMVHKEAIEAEVDTKDAAVNITALAILSKTLRMLG